MLNNDQLYRKGNILGSVMKSDERIDCPKLNVWLIFRHSQEEYFEQISELIEKEYIVKRLKDSHYKYVKNHLKDRPS
jgi:hypothetical protein